MNMTGPVTALSLAIAAYRAAPYFFHEEPRQPCRLTSGEEAMLDRLQESPEATEAFASWGLPDRKTPFFFADCVQAHRLADGEHAKQVEAYRSAPKPEQAREALAEIERFFRGSLFETIPDPPPVPEAPKTWEEFANCQTYIRGPDQGPLGEAIDLLRLAINDEERYREEYRWSSQKSDVTAADSRAVGLVKESVLRASGRPDLKVVRAIAVVVTGRRDEDITLDDVKNATTPSEWREKRRITAACHSRSTFSAKNRLKRANT
jgi:hypothetical protein